jgi:hypothetical protein
MRSHDAMLANRNFISETAHKFQGDERDLIVFSPVMSRGIPVSAAGFSRARATFSTLALPALVPHSSSSEMPRHASQVKCVISAPSPATLPITPVGDRSGHRRRD